MPTPEVEIASRVEQLLASLPPGVTLVAAAKGRTAAEVAAAVAAGIRHVGHNYVQEARAMRQLIDARPIHAQVTWHMIGHLQRNKAALAVELFDMIQTVDSLRLARELERRCSALGRVMPVLIEVNSGRESAKAGALPEEVEPLAEGLGELSHLQLRGLMTMGPLVEDREQLRACFRLTRETLAHLEQRGLVSPPAILSMGMSDSYQLAIDEGANMVRLGTQIFGPRPGQVPGPSEG